MLVAGGVLSGSTMDEDELLEGREAFLSLSLLSRRPLLNPNPPFRLAMTELFLLTPFEFESWTIGRSS
jgi:hypothetical protein